MITRTPVTSSSIASVGHDPDTNTTEVEFNNGSIYSHTDSSAEDHAALLAAPSIGKHYNTHFRGKKPHTKVK